MRWFQTLFIVHYVDFGAFRTRKVVHHLSVLKDLLLTCGVDGCTLLFRHIRLFKHHLNEIHPYFYPDALEGLPAFSDDSIFCTNFTFENQTECQFTNNSDLTSPLYTDLQSNHPDINLFDSNSNLENINSLTTDFTNILGQHGAKNNMAFSSMQSLSASLIDYFYKNFASSSDFNNNLAHSLHNSIFSAEKFDSVLEKKFKAVFPEVINIRGSNFTFVYFQFKKCFDFLLSKFSSFSEVIKSAKNSTIDSFLSSTQASSAETIYLNIFFDDFQLANPLLKKGP